VVPQVKTDPADADDLNLKKTSSLTTYGRDEKYVENKLYLLGASSVILYGVGDGMIPYCCLMKRIPCLLIYDKRPGGELHQKTIQKFLVGKVQALMEVAAPGTRWFRTSTQLGCREEKKRKQPDGTPAPKKKVAKAAGAAPKNTGEKSSSDDDSSDHSNDSKKSKKSPKKKKTEE